MIRTYSYRFTEPGDLDLAIAKIKQVAQARCRVAAHALYGVNTEIDGKDLIVDIRVDGHGYFGAMVRARKEVQALGRALRMKENSITEVSNRTEPTMRNLTVSQGRSQSYANRTETRLRNRAARLARFREENEQWLAPPSP